MGKRILVAIPIVIIVALAVFVQGWVLAVFAAALACACQYEVVRAMDGNGKPVLKPVSYVFAGILAALFLMSYPSVQAYESLAWLTPAAVVVLFVVMAMATFIAAMFCKKHTAESAFHTTFTMVYPQLFFVLFYLLILSAASSADPDRSGYLRMILVLLMIFLPAMFSDTAAYFIGKTFGKTKLCPSISPKKTVAGSVAGVVGGAVAAVLIWLVFANMQRLTGHFYLVAPLGAYIAAGAVLAAISQFGDLAASYLKRALGIKDFGKLLPGHGGIVDRMDSVLFCIPVVYILASVFYVI